MKFEKLETLLKRKPKKIANPIYRSNKTTKKEMINELEDMLGMVFRSMNVYHLARDDLITLRDSVKKLKEVT